MIRNVCLKKAFVGNELISRIFLLILFYFVTVSTTQATSKKPLTLKYNLSGTEYWIPYGYSKDDDNPGIFAEVVTLILQEANLSYKFYYYPPKRAAQEFKKDQLDIDFMSPSWFKDGDMGDEYVQSKSIFELTEYNVTLPENADKYATPDSIHGKRVGTIRGYSYFNDHLFNRVDFSSESALIKGLKKGRYEVAILENLTAQHWAQVHNVEISLASIHSHGEIVLRIRRELVHLLPELNAAISSLKQSGEIDSIFQHYREILENMAKVNE
ncbi:MAG: transporter substrate-binding domain-containing protein [Aliiglaciecola sp.]|uniref:substrate-binding periplasmic protein n=1 Tax=Aliiglaciecola sp. TaxID=1872441 RepID=UPI003299558E